MKAATVSELKKELRLRSNKELIDICLSLSKFKKENKELMTYLLYEASNESAYIQSVKNEVEYQFGEINTSNYYFIKKGVRKILRNVKKYIRYSKKKETEAELLIHFCQQMNEFSPSLLTNMPMFNLYHRQVAMIEKAVATLHEDLQYDYALELEQL